MPSDSASPAPTSAPDTDQPLPLNVSAPPAATAPIDTLLRSILAGAAGRVAEDQERAGAAGLIDAEGRLLTERWPDDMRADSRTSIETG